MKKIKQEISNASINEQILRIQNKILTFLEISKDMHERHNKDIAELKSRINTLEFRIRGMKK